MFWRRLCLDLVMLFVALMHMLLVAGVGLGVSNYFKSFRACDVILLSKFVNYVLHYFLVMFAFKMVVVVCLREIYKVTR